MNGRLKLWVKTARDGLNFHPMEEFIERLERIERALAASQASYLDTEAAAKLTGISKVTLEPLLKFMRRMETYQSNLVLVTQLSIRARDDKHQEFEVDMTISTYEHAPKTAAKPGDKGGKESGTGPAEKESL